MGFDWSQSLKAVVGYSKSESSQLLWPAVDPTKLALVQGGRLKLVTWKKSATTT